LGSDTPNEDKLHTISEWYDGPRAGATEYKGKPYWYRSVYIDSDVWDPNEDRFELTPLTEEVLSWELESTKIFERWDSARKNGSIAWNEGDEGSFGAMPEDMHRYREINEGLQTYLSRTDPQLLVRATFDSGPKIVRWEVIETISKLFERAQLTELKALLHVFADAFEDHASYQSAVPSDEYLNKLLARDDFIPLVAVADGKVVGGLAAYVLQKFEQERSEIYIYDLAVLEANRRQGIATGLINKLRERAREIGAYVIYVQADPPDEPAVKLYESLGIREDVLHFDIKP